MWFCSFDLAQGYLQFAMEESDIKKITFRARSSGLHEVTSIHFSLFLGWPPTTGVFISHFPNKAKCLHDLTGPITSKSKQRGKKKTKPDAEPPTKPEQKHFKWNMERQEAFHTLKMAL